VQQSCTRWCTMHDPLPCISIAPPRMLCVNTCCIAAHLQTSGLSTKQLRSAATALGMDCSWCLERSELLAVYKRGKQVRLGHCACTSHTLLLLLREADWMLWAAATGPLGMCLEPIAF
jgi:hypothetical protein